MVKLSVVIPYYKTYELTKELLNKLIPQLSEQVEVFLIDDGCDEKKLDKFDKDINIIHLEKNIGGASACNIGIKRSKGKYIALIDSDDMIADDYIETLLKHIDERTEDVIFFSWQDIHTKQIVKKPSNYAPWKAIYKKEVIPLFRDGWRYSYDVPFQEDLEKTNYSRYYIDKVLYYYNSNRIGSLTLEKAEKARKERKMVKCEAIRRFTLDKFDELENIVRKSLKTKGKLFIGDTFDCTKEMADYLTGNNDKNLVVAKVLEIIPSVKKDK